MDTTYEEPFVLKNSDFEIKQEPFEVKLEDNNHDGLLGWTQFVNESQQPADLMNVLGTTDIDMSNLMDQSICWSQPSLDTSFESLFAPWNTIKEEWSFNLPEQQQQSSYMLPPTPPVNNNNNNCSSNNINIFSSNDFSSTFQPPQLSRETTPPSSIAASSGSNSPNSNLSTPPPTYYIPQPIPQLYHQLPLPAVAPQKKTRGPARRKSAETHSTTPRTYRHRSSSHPSVASVVSLTAHEPVAHMINGIEHITFLYSHDRLVKEYTVRTDVEKVNLEDIPSDFRAQNAIYPRANVSREEYDGNRWEYETSCNKLGWELCWLNQELSGRRGLIQRAVDSYRNRHAEMRSRRVTRQEKVANGTLRKRRVKKSITSLL